MNLGTSTSTPNYQDNEAYPRTLYVGNLDPNVSESLIMELFSVIGPCKSCKMIPDPNGGDPYCFVEFMDHSHALAAHAAMNQRKILGKEIRVNWATRPSSKRDTSGHHHIFVGDLAPETTSDDLKNYFSKIGLVSDARVMRDLQTNKSKGYGFVSFINYQDAQDLVEKKRIIPEALHGRQVRCNWAARKGGQTGGRAFQKLDFSAVVSQSSQTNCTVYLGGCMSGLTEQLMRNIFSEFGNIVEIRVFPDKGYSFIRFDNHSHAAQAITSKHGTTLEGYTVKCSWGKEGAIAPSGQSAVAPGYNNGMGQPGADNMQQMNQWSPAGGEMWGQNQQQQQQQPQYNQWAGGWSQNQSQAPQQQQQNPWNTWGASNQNNTWGMASNNAWGTNNSNQQMQNPWGWSGVGQQQQPQPGRDDPWGMNNQMQGSQQANGDGMWNNWNSPGMGNPQADMQSSSGGAMGDQGPNSNQPMNGFHM